jgi:hypothetical protein
MEIMEVLSGTASNVLHSTETQGRIRSSSISGRVRGNINTTHVCTLRVGGLPVRIRLPGATNLNDGDVVTVVGARKSDGFQGYVLRNESTGTVHAYPTWPAYLLAVVGIVGGIPLSLVIVGLPMLAAGVWGLWMGLRQTRALAMLKATAAPSMQVSRG